MCFRGAEILEKRGIQRPVSYFKNTQVSNIGILSNCDDTVLSLKCDKSRGAQFCFGFV